MSLPKRTDSSAVRLASLVRRVVSLTCAFEDVEHLVEEAAFALCRQGRTDAAVGDLRSLAGFFEAMERKSEENLRGLGRVYLLLGEILQAFDRAEESIAWFQKAVVVDERDARPYQGMARSYLAVGDVDKAIRGFEQEIALAPGNYFSYLTLANLYEKRGEADKVEACLDKLLSRDPDNVQALHELIVHHRGTHPELDVEFLRRRLLSISRPLSKKELLIWAFHMCEEGRVEETARRAQETYPPADRPYWLLVAWYCADISGRIEERKAAASRLKGILAENSRILKTWVDEVVSVFGDRAARSLSRDLASVRAESG